MSEHTLQQRTSWTTRRDEKARRMRGVQAWMRGPLLPREKMVEALESVIVSGDRIVMEGVYEYR
jgi:malonate decarboxylase alpha subunit